MKMLQILNTTFVFLFFSICFFSYAQSFAFDLSHETIQKTPQVYDEDDLTCSDKGELYGRRLANYYKQDFKLLNKNNYSFHDNLPIPSLSKSCLKKPKEYFSAIENGFNASLNDIKRRDERCFKQVLTIKIYELNMIYKHLHRTSLNQLDSKHRKRELTKHLQIFSQKCKHFEKTQSIIDNAQEELKYVYDNY